MPPSVVRATGENEATTPDCKQAGVDFKPVADPDSGRTIVCYPTTKIISVEIFVISMTKTQATLRKLNHPLRVSEAARQGIAPAELYAMEARGEVERLARGVFVAAGRPPLENPDFAVVCLRAPRAVVCLVSALWFHDLTTQVLGTVDVAVRRGDHRPHSSWPPVKCYSFSPASYASGIETHTIDGVDVKVYSREKTLADCFKFRNRIGMDVVLEALHFYSEGTWRVDELLRQARICRIEAVMRPYLETALWTGVG